MVKKQEFKKTKRCVVCGKRRILEKMHETKYRNKNNKTNDDKVFLCKDIALSDCWSLFYEYHMYKSDKFFINNTIDDYEISWYK